MAIIKRTDDDYIFDGITNTINENNGYCVIAREKCMCKEFIDKVKQEEIGTYCPAQRYYIAELPKWYTRET